jgi:hypothetical protein
VCECVCVLSRGCTRVCARVEYYVSGALVFIHFALTTGTHDALSLLLIGFGIATIMPCKWRGHPCVSGEGCVCSQQFAGEGW